LNQYNAWPSAVDYEVYLQGSYKNDTNIRGDSDVDVVVELKSSYFADVSQLSAADQQRYWQNFSPTTYPWQDFRADILRALQKSYGSKALPEGRKSLKVVGESGRVPADVVVCMEHQRYQYSYGFSNQRCVKGMTFYVPSESRWVVNYPKLHYDNGVAKNSLRATNGCYKPAVRMFKNARTYLIDRQLLASDRAPSYFVECLFYNVPDALFGSGYQRMFLNILHWLNRATIDPFMCQNGQLSLFGNSPEQWSVSDARIFLRVLSHLWDNW
jgi:hypothetical protein